MTDVDRELDMEWVELMLEAKKTGVSMEDIRSFLHGDCQEKSSIALVDKEK